MILIGQEPTSVPPPLEQALIETTQQEKVALIIRISKIQIFVGQSKLFDRIPSTGNYASFFCMFLEIMNYTVEPFDYSVQACSM